MIIFVLICTVGINAVRNLAPWYEDAISMVTINTTLPWRRRLLPQLACLLGCGHSSSFGIGRIFWLHVS